MSKFMEAALWVAGMLAAPAVAQIRAAPVGGTAHLPPPVAVPMQPLPLTVQVQVVPSATLSTTPSTGVPAPFDEQVPTTNTAAEAVPSVDVQVVPPPEPPEEPPPDADCHDGNALDNVDSCEESASTSEPATVDFNAAGATGGEPINAEVPPAPQPAKGQFPGLVVAIGLGIFAFVLFRRGRRR